MVKNTETSFQSLKKSQNKTIIVHKGNHCSGLPEKEKTQSQTPPWIEGDNEEFRNPKKAGMCEAE